MNAGSQLGLEVEKARLGYGRVSIDDIEFACDLSGHLLRPVEPKNITRLERVFELEGVLRLLPEHYIAGIAPSHVNTQDLTQVRGAREPPWVRPADGRKIPCLYGRHRIEAAKAALPKRDQWWIVELFSTQTPLPVQLHLAHEHDNSSNFPDGYIFRNLRRFKDHPSEKKWMAKLSAVKQRDYKQLNNKHHETLMNALDALLPFVGLWEPFLLGTFHRILNLKCTPELTRYLQLVRDTWSSIVVGLVPPSAVDAQTVNELQLLHPRLSTCDRVKIREAFETKRAFPGIEDRTTRAELLRRAFACQSLIPSIYTFLEDTKLLEPAAIIMKKLVAGKWEKKEQIESRYRENYSGTEPQYSLRYQSLWLFSIAHFPELIDMAPRKDAGRQKPTVKEVSAARWKCLADTARRLGFDSQSIDAFANIDAHSATIRAFLLRLYPDMEDQVCTTLVAEVNKVIAGQSDHRHRTQDSPIFTTDLIDVGPDRRCGRPFAEDHEVNRPFCDYPFMWQSTDVPARRYIGPFTVLQSIFQAFFGAPNVDSAMGEDSGEEAQPTNVEEDPSTEDDIDPPPDHREDVDGTTSGGDRRDAQPTKVDELPHTEDNIGRPPDHHEGATGAMNGNDRRDAHLTDKSAVLSQDQADSISQSQRDLDEHLQDVDDSLFHPSNDSISWEGSDESQSHPPNGTTNVGGEPFRRLQQPALPQVPQPQRPASLEQILDENPWKLYPRPLPHSADVSPTTETCGKRTWTGTRQTQSRAKRKARRAPQEVLETIEKFVHTVTTQLGNNIAISEDPRQGPLMLHSYNTIQELKSALAARDKDGLKLTYWVIAESGNGNYVSRQDLAPRHKLLFALWQDSGQDRNVNILDRVVRHFKDAPPHKVESKIMKPSAEKLREELVQHYILHYDGSESMNGWEGGSAIWQIAVDEGEY